MKITYGTTNYNIDVTDICLSKLKINNIIIIPSGDYNRANYFTDPIFGTLKKIFITIDEWVIEYDDTLSIKINIIDKTITTFKYTAIIVEPRKHNALSFVLNNFVKNLSDDWYIIIFHGNLNIDFINNIINCNLLDYKKRISLVNLHIDNLPIADYNNLFIKNTNFFDAISTETFLVFQTDSMIFENHKHLINDFLKYDYVGAPWSHKPKNDQQVGNGGLSLRKKSKMLEIIKVDSDTNVPEDVFFSCTDKVSLYKPSPDEAKHFSIEMIFSDTTFGCHKPWEHLKSDSRLFQYYHDIKYLESLQNSI